MSFEVVLLIGGLIGLVALGVPIAFALAVACLPLILLDPRLDFGIVVHRSYNALDSFLLLAVPFFLLAGNLMNEARVTEKLVRMAYGFVGHLRGGLAHVNVLVSMLFAGISGSSTADTAGVGSVLIPAMKEKGYDVPFSVAITAASSVMGIIIPPSLVMVVWGAITGTSVSALFAGGILPGILVGVGQMAVIVWLAKRRGYPTEPRQSLPEVASNTRQAILPLLMPLIILGGIMFGIFTPTEASILAVLYALFLGVVVYRTIKFRNLYSVLLNTVRISSLSLFCVATAGVFGWMLAYYRVPYEIAQLSSTIDNPMLLLAAIALTFLVLGTFLDGLVVAIIIGPIFLPSIAALGIDPVQYGIIATVSVSIGLVTPPYGLCLFLASTIGGIEVEDALADTLILVGVMIVILALLIIFPQITMFLPGLLLG
ncbi:TRAP transporter large permease [Oceanomicrobium pacificus]|uniref:TRAP transporter large permease protein n=1 Tax=Oceanomicrobium pacificus TaxID=2692916 RepID=A0A6B0TT03_9RHOB|nr:TRAP transporter large permease [Oceanomicrobium pacificus]MXU64352.1 TRAP transporter large permease subunit [Oceanomicrobium pacificus]